MKLYDFYEESQQLTKTNKLILHFVEHHYPIVISDCGSCGKEINALNDGNYRSLCNKCFRISFISNTNKTKISKIHYFKNTHVKHNMELKRDFLAYKVINSFDWD